MQTMEQYLFNIPSHQVGLIIELMNQLKIEGRKIEEPMIDDNLTPEQNARLQESIRQADAGEVISFEEYKKQAKQWLKR